MQTLEPDLTREETAENLRVSVRMVDQFIADGKLTATRYGRRVLIQPQHLREFREANVSNHSPPSAEDSKH